MKTFFTMYKKDADFRKQVSETKGFCLDHFKVLLQGADEMLNEKIVIYLKHQFRSKTTFSLKEYKDIIILLTYLHNKDQYIKFVLNEYTQMRKKFIEENAWRANIDV